MTSDPAGNAEQQPPNAEADDDSDKDVDAAATAEGGEGGLFIADTLASEYS